MQVASDLAGEFPNVTYAWGPDLKRSVWYGLARALRFSLDYLRYLDPRFDESPKLRTRAEQFAPTLIAWLSRLPLIRTRRGILVFGAILKALEESVPPGIHLVRFIQRQAPDAVLVTPMLYLGSPQVDYVRAAMQVGIPTGVAVASWDHLTTKGLIHCVPDIVLVWNEYQKAEAVEFHSVPPERVVVTGAHAYDHWFQWKPQRTREDFSQRVGLDPAKPILLYLCSSPFIAPDEVSFIRKWIHAIRSSGSSSVRSAGILIRPHYQHLAQWSGIDLTESGNIAIWPRSGGNPVNPETKAEYFDSIYHSAATIGVNTSALIEAGIVGRPVYTILDDEFAQTQRGTIHFKYLLNVNGGLLTVARDLAEHVAQLDAEMDKRDGAHRTAGQKFLEAFVRPYGLDAPATSKMVEAIEQLSTLPSHAAVSGVSLKTALLRTALLPPALIARIWLAVRG